MVHYLVLFVTLYQRLPTNAQLPRELHPVFFLFIAAPSVASVCWARLCGDFNYAAKIFYFTHLRRLGRRCASVVVLPLVPAERLAGRELLVADGAPVHSARGRPVGGGRRGRLMDGDRDILVFESGRGGYTEACDGSAHRTSALPALHDWMQAMGKGKGYVRMSQLSAVCLLQQYKRENVNVERREKTKAVDSAVLCCQCDFREAENTSSPGHASAGRRACEREARRELQFLVAFNKK
jgi:hypothetical protein